MWDDALRKELAELEFREKVRGLACRRGWLAVALRRRVVLFEVGEQVTRHAEWDTCDNPRGRQIHFCHVSLPLNSEKIFLLSGLLAIATSPHATLLAIAGRQMGHVQLIHLPPCPPPISTGPPSATPPSKPPPPPSKHPVSIIAAHTTALTTVSLPPSGRLLATTSTRGTLVRVWDALTGKLVREFRRGTDKAEIYGVAFRPDERELCVWSDKGTVHVFTLGVSGASYVLISTLASTPITCQFHRNRQSTFSPLAPFLPLPKYFESEWSYAQYRIPVQSSHISISSTSRSATADVHDEERCVVGWVNVSEDDPDHRSIPEYQLIALTYTGGWYRLSLPNKGNASNISSKGHMSGSPPNVSSPLQPRTSSGSSIGGRTDKGKERERDKDSKESRKCVLQEFRRFGRWDGWG